MAGKDNLVPQDRRTKEEQREIARQGGIASGKARLAKKRGKELMLALLENRVVDEKVLSAMKAAGYNPEEITNELALHIRQIEKAQKTGDTKAYTAVMKMAGYDEQTINLNGVSPIVADNPEQAEAISAAIGEREKRKTK